MKQFLITCCLFGILISCSNKKSLKFSSFIIKNDENFGIVKVGDTIHDFFLLVNTSDTVLKINSIKTSCNCTVVSLSDSLANQNKTIRVDFTFIPDLTDIGMVSKPLVIDANTKPNFTTLFIEGTVKDIE